MIIMQWIYLLTFLIFSSILYETEVAENKLSSGVEIAVKTLFALTSRLNNDFVLALIQIGRPSLNWTVLIN